MRFKEFFPEAQQDLQPGHSLFAIPGGETIQIPTAIRQKFNDQQILALLQQQGYQPPANVDKPASTSWHVSNPGPAAPQAGQGAKMTTPPDQTTELPPGYREFKLPNGNLTAVPQQLDDKQALALIQRRRPDLLTPVAQSMSPKKPTRVIIPSDMAALPVVDQKLMGKAKQVADTYLGRAMTPQEWDHLLRATYAESGHSEKEDAHIMATILNRARQGGFGGKNISRVLTSPQQFQSVTGTAVDHSIASTFTQGPPKQSLTIILNGVVNHLLKVPKDIGYFTSNKEAAYKAGTNKDFLKKMKQSGGNVIGQSVFAKMDPQGHIVKQPAPVKTAPIKTAKK